MKFTQFGTYGSTGALFEEVRTKGLPVPTGFSKLDEILKGGIRPGELFVIGAPPATGKTAFCVQMAAQMARSGVTCLYFSLEMSTAEIAARVICLESRRQFGKLIEEADILNGCLGMVSKLNDDEINSIWSEVSDNLQIVESPFNFSVEQMLAEINRVKQATGGPVCVFVDYLQLLAAGREGETRAALDATLRQLAIEIRQQGVPCIAISSLNREGYRKRDYSAFKESGNVEYDADGVFMLTPTLFETTVYRDADTVEQAALFNAIKKADAITMTLTSLKLRGRNGVHLMYSYHMANNYFDNERTPKPKNASDKNVKTAIAEIEKM
jgi:replicative DNA helicase